MLTLCSQQSHYFDSKRADIIAACCAIHVSSLITVPTVSLLVLETRPSLFIYAQHLYTSSKGDLSTLRLQSFDWHVLAVCMGQLLLHCWCVSIVQDAWGCLGILISSLRPFSGCCHRSAHHYVWSTHPSMCPHSSPLETICLASARCLCQQMSLAVLPCSGLCWRLLLFYSGYRINSIAVHVLACSQCIRRFPSLSGSVWCCTFTRWAWVFPSRFGGFWRFLVPCLQVFSSY